MRVEEQESVCEGSELTRIEKADQASERDTNQHLLIASGIPRGETDLRWKGKEEGLENRKITTLMLVREYKGVSYPPPTLRLSTGHSVG